MPSMGARSLSFRLAKTKSVFESDDHKQLHSNKSSTLGSTSASDQMTPNNTSGKLTSSSEGGTSSQEEKTKAKSRKSMT